MFQISCIKPPTHGILLKGVSSQSTVWNTRLRVREGRAEGEGGRRGGGVESGRRQASAWPHFDTSYLQLREASHYATMPVMPCLHLFIPLIPRVPEKLAL